jgi:hypothetical protein
MAGTPRSRCVGNRASTIQIEAGRPASADDCRRYIDYCSDTDFTHPCLVSIHGVDTAYVELYRAESTPLADLPGVAAGARGFHILIGDESSIGRGVAVDFLGEVVSWLFAHDQDMPQLVANPSANNTRAISMFEKLGLHAVGTFDIGYKTATLLTVQRAEWASISA